MPIEKIPETPNSTSLRLLREARSGTRNSALFTHMDLTITLKALAIFRNLRKKSSYGTFLIAYLIKDDIGATI